MAQTVLPREYDSRYDMSSLMPAVDITTGPDVLARPGKRTVIIDALDERFTEIVEGIRVWVPHTWKGEKLTTLCYRAHGTPNTKMIVLAYNGLSHDMQLRPGMVLRIPLRSEIDRMMQETALLITSQNGAGSIVTI